MTVYAPPASREAPPTVQARYDNWIGGEFVAPVEGKYFENPSPVTGQVYCEVARSTAEDVELRARRGPRRRSGAGARPRPGNVP